MESGWIKWQAGIKSSENGWLGMVYFQECLAKAVPETLLFCSISSDPNWPGSHGNDADSSNSRISARISVKIHQNT